MTDFLPDYTEIEREISGPGLEPSYRALPAAFLRDSISPLLLHRIQTQEDVALLVVAPSASWIEPISEALIGLREWASVIVGDPQARRPPSEDIVSQCLAAGRPIAAVGSNVERQLPACIAQAADETLALGVVGNPAIAQTIKAATGGLPLNLPPRIAAGLDYHDLVSAIRIGSTPETCVARLLAASRIRNGAQPTEEIVPVQQLHGYGEAHVWAMRLIAGLERWRNGKVAFASLDRCVVLASRPGLGKTSFVRSLAKSAGLPLVATTASDWFTGRSDGYLSGVLREVERVFTDAAAMAPGVLLIDELDALPSRATTGRNSDFWAAVLTKILVMLDGATLGPASRLIVVGATNHAERLDPALVRPGRLNRIITIHPPNACELAAIMRQHLGDDLPGRDLTVAANLAVGSTGAQIADWVKIAREAALQANRPFDIDDLLQTIAPDDGRPAQDLYRTAVHEAGHAVVADWLWPGSVLSVSIVAREDTAGTTAIERPRELSPTRAMIEEQVLLHLAGRAAEIVILHSASAGAGGAHASDLGVATKLLAAVHASFGLGASAVHLADRRQAGELLVRSPSLLASVTSDLARLEKQALRVTCRLRAPIVGVASALVRDRVLSGAEFHRLRVNWPRPHRRRPQGRGRHPGPA